MHQTVELPLFFPIFGLENCTLFRHKWAPVFIKATVVFCTFWIMLHFWLGLFLFLAPNCITTITFFPNFRAWKFYAFPPQVGTSVHQDGCSVLYFLNHAAFLTRPISVSSFISQWPDFISIRPLLKQTLVLTHAIQCDTKDVFTMQLFPRRKAPYWLYNLIFVQEPCYGTTHCTGLNSATRKRKPNSFLQHLAINTNHSPPIPLFHDVNSSHHTCFMPNQFFFFFSSIVSKSKEQCEPC